MSYPQSGENELYRDDELNAHARRFDDNEGAGYRMKTVDPNLLSLTIIVQDEKLVAKENEYGEIYRDIEIHCGRSVEDLIIEIKFWLKKQGTLPDHVHPTSFKLWFKN